MYCNRLFKFNGYSKRKSTLVAANDIDAAAVLWCLLAFTAIRFCRQDAVSQSLVEMIVLTSRFTLLSALTHCRLSDKSLKGLSTAQTIRRCPWIPSK